MLYNLFPLYKRFIVLVCQWDPYKCVCVLLKEQLFFFLFLLWFVFLAICLTLLFAFRTSQAIANCATQLLCQPLRSSGTHPWCWGRRIHRGVKKCLHAFRSAFVSDQKDCISKFIRAGKQYFRICVVAAPECRPGWCYVPWREIRRKNSVTPRKIRLLY